MDNRYAVTPNPKHNSETCQNDKGFQASDTAHIKESITNAEQNCVTKTLPVADESDAKETQFGKKGPLQIIPTLNPNSEAATEDSLLKVNETNTIKEAESLRRLQQAVHILATGAIRAAQKQKAALDKPQKDTYSSISSISGFRTSVDIQCEKKQQTQPKQSLTTLKSGLSDERDTAQVL